MSGKKGSCGGGDLKIDVMINVPLPAAKPGVDAEKRGGGGGCYVAVKGWVRAWWQFAREDTNRVVFALKVGLAVLLVSLLILFRATYDIFGANIIWSILTVAIMFEYTVGATFNKGFNRALGSLLAGIFAIAVMKAAMSVGGVAEPYVIGLSIFLIGALTSFIKLWPSFVPYEYGFRVTLFTYCLIIVSGYRMGAPLRTAMDRLYSIAIGGLVAVVVNVAVCPIWAGEQLHQELVKCFASVADSLEECVRKYMGDDGSDRPEFAKTVMDDFADEPAYKTCRAMLNSSSKLDSLAGSAKWEPPHGRFRHFFYPWSEYVKVGNVLRHCAYEVMALHGCLHSEIQAPYNLKLAFQSEILDAADQAAELLRSLGHDISAMKHGAQTTGLLVMRAHASAERLQRSIDLHSYLLTPSAAPDSASLLKRAPSCRDANTPPLPPPPAAVAAAAAPQGEWSYHESMRRQQRRLYSWPSREVDGFDDADDGAAPPPRMRALESTAALSLATFTSLLIEFVARLDHLVDAVDELAKLAQFEEELEK